MSQNPIPGPFGDYGGIVREVLGDEYQVVLAVYNKIPELRQMVKDVHDGAKEAIDTKIAEELKVIDAAIDAEEKRLQDHVDCVTKAFDDRNEAYLDGSRKALKEAADGFRSQMEGWSTTLLDNLTESQKPAMDALIASLQNEAQSVTSGFLSSINDAGNKQIESIQSAQSGMQIVSYSSNTDNLGSAPIPDNTSMSALLYWSINGNLRIYVWNISAKAWGNKLLELAKPVDGAEGPAGTCIVTAAFYGTQFPATVSRSDGSVVQPGDLLLNTIDGELYAWSKGTGTHYTWVAVTNLKGATGPAGTNGSTTLTGVSTLSSKGMVHISSQYDWPGGANKVETLTWPYGFIFKYTPIYFFRFKDTGADSNPTTDPTVVPVQSPGCGIVSNITLSGFQYTHESAWPGSYNDGTGWKGYEKLWVEVWGEPDWDAMAKAGWTPPSNYYMAPKVSMSGTGVPYIQTFTVKAYTGDRVNFPVTYTGDSLPYIICTPLTPAGQGNFITACNPSDGTVDKGGFTMNMYSQDVAGHDVQVTVIGVMK